MSAPDTTQEDPIQGAMNELVSAMSSLNMPPERIVRSFPGTTPEPEDRFLSKTDVWAAHAMEHLHAAFELINRAHLERELLKAQVFRLEVKLVEQKVVTTQLPGWAG